MGKKKLNLQKIRVSKLYNLHNIKGGTGVPADDGSQNALSGCIDCDTDGQTKVQSNACERDSDAVIGRR